MSPHSDREEHWTQCQDCAIHQLRRALGWMIDTADTLPVGRKDLLCMGISKDVLAKTRRFER